MKKNDLIQKWLDHNLNESELAAFKKLDAYSSLSQIDAAAQAYKAPKFDADATYSKLHKKLYVKPKKRIQKYIMAVAAVLVIGFVVSSTIFKNNVVTHATIAGAQKQIVLPDASEITLLSNSEIHYDQKEWDDFRAISLKGAAYFDVEKGKTFSVKSEHGLVTVLGTEFSVKDWGTYFEVICYEGSVRVKGFNQSEVLSPGMSFIALDNSVTIHNDTAPWSAQATHFNKVPITAVLEFIEKNYAVSINNITNVKGSFTGSVSHENLEEALQTVTIPFQLTFEVKNKTVILKSK